MTNIIISSVIAYFLGSFPTAYLIVKKKSQIDISENGSGNVGAFNSFKVTKSYFVGFSVLAIDFLKGFAAVYIAKSVFGESFEIVGAAALFAVVGHCFSIWMKFKGGRGIATAAGASVLVVPILIALWIVLWIIAYLYKRNVHFSNIMAIFLSLLLVVFNTELLNNHSAIGSPNNFLFGTICSLILFTMLIKHYGPLKEYFKFEKDKNKRIKDETT
ncbi:MAG: glycerol-3-phosphate acyltransferase [Chlorobi bacterium]|nr:glycerol-3-phosphate acyltransferase [Chlorobiota bacterium]